MNHNRRNRYSINNSRGSVAIIVAASLFMLLGFGALAIDIGHQAIVRNELQNAADAGALAGALALFDASGNVNPDSNARGQTAAMANLSDNIVVEVDLGNNDSDVQRGSWDFTTQIFTKSNSPIPNDINAMMVRTHRSSSPSWLSRILGYDSFSKDADAVAYIGFAGSSITFDQPIAICQERITDSNGDYDCTIGRMYNNGSSANSEITGETARWTNFSAECADTANTPSISGAVCSGGVTSGVGEVSTSNGEVQPAMDDLYSCWETATNKAEPWALVLPVIACPDSISPTCSQIVGAVQVEVVWYTPKGKDPHYEDIPMDMGLGEGQELDGWPGDWHSDVECADLDLALDFNREICWERYMHFFNIQDVNLDPYAKIPNTLYFRPSCDFDVDGGPGGVNFSVLAQYPKLVK